MADNIGKVVQVIGATVDCEFHSDHLPEILNAIKIEDKEKEIDLTVEAAMHIGDNIVRCVSLASTDGLVRGMEAVDTGAPISVPVGEITLGRVFNLLGQPIDNLGDIPKDTERSPIHRPTPSFAEQDTTTEILETGRGGRRGKDGFDSGAYSLYCHRARR